MQRIEMKIGFFRWLTVFVVLSIGNGAVAHFLIRESLSFTQLLIISMITSLFITLTMAVVQYFSQSSLAVDTSGVYVEGRNNRELAFEQVREIKVGPGGVTLRGNGNRIHLTSIYSNFREAIQLAGSQLRNNKSVRLVGDRYYIEKYFGVSNPVPTEMASPLLFHIPVGRRKLKLTVYRLLGFVLVMLGLAGLLLYSDELFYSNDLLYVLSMILAGFFLLAEETRLGGFRRLRIEWLAIGMLGGMIIGNLALENAGLGSEGGLMLGIIASLITGSREVEAYF